MFLVQKRWRKIHSCEHICMAHAQRTGFTWFVLFNPQIYTSGTATFILNSIQATHTDALSIVQNELEKILLKISTVLI